MTRQRQPQNSDQALSFLKNLLGQLRLLWRLLNDPRVPAWVKTIPAVVLLYLIFPIDLAPDPALGLGQLDDLAVILLGLKLFRDFSPPDVVREHQAEIAGRDSPWRVVENEPTSEREDISPYVDAEYRIVDKD